MSLFQKIKSYLFNNTSAKQTIIKNTFRLLIAEGVSKGSLFLISILIARQLGPEQFGVMSFVISFVSLFIVLTDFGLTTLMVREVSRDESKLSEYFVN
ncbi:MAG: oligosaccharide flippase family protein [bacterium]